jgi:hypothetical protein
MLETRILDEYLDVRRGRSRRLERLCTEELFMKEGGMVRSM